ncbi:MAG: exosortase [Phenylobacterium sp.]|uniref:exosortase V n=1 Tax=Phenylobacterium sp. TaxID=1871053 RepID=UPI0025D41796|nr:exosortase V [Phenylobacterium sp.]MBI1198448.1 exosortase [Phenylobacterium sp.]
MAALQDSQPPIAGLSGMVRYSPVILALLVLGIPTLIRLGEQSWTKEIGAHGPIVLMTGAWLLSRRWDAMCEEGRRGDLRITIPVSAFSLAAYVFGRAYDFLSIEAGGFYGFALALLYDRFGLRTLMRSWFPLFYLAFALPIPGWILDRVTAPLKLLVSYLATAVVDPLGLPIIREGVTMTVGPYQLLVEDACSGLNSLVGLIAVTLFYVYLLRGAGWRYSLFLTALIVPVAILANVLRIVTLILLTYFMGDSVGQGFLHITAGLFLFGLSLGLMFLIDNGIGRFAFRERAVVR